MLAKTKKKHELIKLSIPMEDGSTKTVLIDTRVRKGQDVFIIEAERKIKVETVNRKDCPNWE